MVGDETFCGLVKFWRAYFHHWNTHLPQLLLFNIFITWPKLLRRLISVEHEMILYTVEVSKLKPSIREKIPSCEKVQFLSQILNTRSFLKNIFLDLHSVDLLFIYRPQMNRSLNELMAKKEIKLYEKDWAARENIYNLKEKYFLKTWCEKKKIEIKNFFSN